MSHRRFNNSGVTLIELLIALVISAILIAGVYRTYIHQQRTYTTQEQVADMQQNVRVAINRMIREIRLAGFGGKNSNTDGENDIINVFVNDLKGTLNGSTQVITPVNDASSIRPDNVGNSDEIIVVAAFKRLGRLDQNANAGDGTVTLHYEDVNQTFNDSFKRYLCIGGRDNYEVTNAPGDATVLTLNPPLRRSYTVRDAGGVILVPEIPVFLVQSIKYGLRVRPEDNIPVLFRDLYPNTASSRRDTVAEHIEDLHFRYVLDGGAPEGVDAPVADPKQIRGIHITITGRTRMSDPQLADGGGFRRRTLVTYIDLRNLRDDSF